VRFAQEQGFLPVLGAYHWNIGNLWQGLSMPLEMCHSIWCVPSREEPARIVVQ
jgi:hypothetical protein